MYLTRNIMHHFAQHKKRHGCGKPIALPPLTGYFRSHGPLSRMKRGHDSRLNAAQYHLGRGRGRSFSQIKTL